MQVEYAATEYQMPRLTKMWTHLERQSGAGKMRGMGEKQIDIDRRLLRSRLAILRGRLEEACVNSPLVSTLCLNHMVATALGAIRKIGVICVHVRSFLWVCWASNDKLSAVLTWRGRSHLWCLLRIKASSLRTMKWPWRAQICGC